MDISVNEPIKNLPATLFLQHNRMKTNGFPILRSVDKECDSGFESNLVVGFHDNCPFICSICKGFPRYPIELSNCGHIFCYDCFSKIRSALDGNGQGISKKCPNCRKIFSIYEIINFEMTSPALNNIYNSYEIRCLYKCGHISSPKAMIKHETMECKNRPVLCTSNRCHTILTDEQMQIHLDECTKRFVYCKKCRLPKIVNNKEHQCIDTNRDNVKCL